MTRIRHDFPLNEIEAVCRRNRISELSVFGSYANGFQTEESDIDLLVEFDPAASVGMLDLGRISRELSAMFGKKVDLIPKSGLKPSIRDQVLKESETLFADRPTLSR